MSSASRAHGTIVADAFKLVEQSDPTPPTAPVVTAHAGETGIDLQWTKGKDNIAVGGYHVLVDSALRYLGTGRTLAVTGLACDSVHVISVRALDMVSNRSPSRPIWVRTARLPAVTAGIGRDAAAAIGRAAVVGAGGRALVRGVRERPARPHDRRDDLHRVRARLRGDQDVLGGERGRRRRRVCSGRRRRDDTRLLTAGRRWQPVRWRVTRPRSSGDRARLS